MLQEDKERRPSAKKLFSFLDNEDEIQVVTLRRIRRFNLNGLDVKNAAAFANFIMNVQNVQNLALLWDEISIKAIKESSISNWEEDGYVEWGFDQRNKRLAIKHRGSLDDYASGRRKHKMSDYDQKSTMDKKVLR